MRRYSVEEKEFLRKIVPGHSHAEIAQLFNARYEQGITTNQVKSFIKNNKLNTGRTGCFPKGNIPYNKGEKGVGGHLPTCFEKGNIPVNHRPVGSTRINKDGYMEVKVEEPRKWRAVHVVVWEKVNGPIPKGHVVIFGDKNKLNIDIGNLLLVSRAELAMLNKYNLIGSSTDLTKIGILIADLRLKMSARKKTRGAARTRTAQESRA